MFIDFCLIAPFLAALGATAKAWAPAIITAGAVLGSALLGKKSTDEANAMSADQFDRQMDFQRNSYKYTAEDMNNAGLNPALLATGAASPSSAPSGSSFSSQSFDGLASVVESIASSYLGAKTNKEISEATNTTQSNIALGNNTTAKEVAAMNNATALAIKTKDKDLQEAQIKLMNEQANNAAAATREQTRSTDYWENVGADPSSSDKFKLTKEAASIITNAIKSSGKSANPSGVSTVIDKYTKLGHGKFKENYPTYRAFCRAISADTGANEKTLMRERTLIEWYKSLKGE